MAAPGSTGTIDGGEPDTRSTSEVLRSLAANAQELARTEVELAKRELTEIATARMIAVALAGAVAMLALLVFVFAGVTVAKALEGVVAAWLAWLIVTGGYLLVAVVLAGAAYYLATHPPNRLERTRASLDETRAWARERFGMADTEVSS